MKFQSKCKLKLSHSDFVDFLVTFLSYNLNVIALGSSQTKDPATEYEAAVFKLLGFLMFE